MKFGLDRIMIHTISKQAAIIKEQSEIINRLIVENNELNEKCNRLTDHISNNDCKSNQWSPAVVKFLEDFLNEY